MRARGAPNERGVESDRDDNDRQAELRAAYEANVAAGKLPYQDVEIRTRGEVNWILRERNWSTDVGLPVGKQHPDFCGGNFFLAELSGTYLSRANLRSAVFRGSTLSDARLVGATLSGADFRGANLIGADLSHTDLNDANLDFAHLSRASLGVARHVLPKKKEAAHTCQNHEGSTSANEPIRLVALSTQRLY